MDHSGSPKSELLMRRAADGDAAASAELLDSYRSRLRCMISLRLDRRIAARVDASDIVQDALNNAYGRLPQYFANPQAPFYVWLRRITVDRLMDMYRIHFAAQKRSVLKEQNWEPNVSDESIANLAQSIVASSMNPGRRAVIAEAQARVREGLLRLKPLDREILILRYLEQMEVEEIAALLDISKTAVTSRHLRAIQRLKQLLGEQSGV